LRRRWTTKPPFVAIAASRGAKAVIAHALDKALFDEITAQLKTKAIRVKTGTLVDATIIASASQKDREATLGQAQGTGGGPWVQGSCGRRRQHGSGRASRDHPANVNDGKSGPDALPDEPDEVLADSAYRGQDFREAVRVKGGSLRVAATGMWGRDEAETRARLEAWN
jgi:transposase, IS5 family